MPRTPLEVKQADLPVSARGYNRALTDQLLKEVANDYETIWWERKDLRDEIERLEGERAGLAEQERLVTATLVAATRFAEELREDARRRAKALVKRAQAESTTIVSDAEGELARVREESRAAEAERDRLREDLRRLQLLANDTRTDLSAYLTATLQRIQSETESDEAGTPSGPEPSLVDDLRAGRPESLPA